MALQANIYDAKARFSELVEKAEHGQETIIARAGKPVAKIVPIKPVTKTKKPRVFGGNVLGITYLAPDAFAPMSDEELAEWGM